MKSFILIGSLLASSLAYAQSPCVERLTILKGKQMAVQLPNASTLNAAKKALEHYQTETGVEPELRDYFAFFNPTWGQVTGYDFVVGAKNKNSRVEIQYFADNKKKLVYAKGKTGTTREYWICEVKATK